ncbi:hypothetical protein FOYG_07408 [Fusarium oxysporum NRRL 32931]|uniref:Uncharacterized protein n=1 Tax=Fusarium oxysporum NRRL 32931 TaxID=660029 RepID=W9I8V8_FUSOX|nr:hypothetical protein FOYG_07408 [Fusarium oxysporum NRRL 32931]
MFGIKVPSTAGKERVKGAVADELQNRRDEIDDPRDNVTDEASDDTQRAGDDIKESLHHCLDCGLQAENGDNILDGDDDLFDQGVNEVGY